MLSQQEAGGPLHEHTDSEYGAYTADQTYTHQDRETSHEPPLSTGTGSGEKVYAQPRDNKNMLRVILAVIAMVMLFLFAVLCMFFPGQTGGWITFCAASLAIFIITVVAIDKIQ